MYTHASPAVATNAVHLEDDDSDSGTAVDGRESAEDRAARRRQKDLARALQQNPLRTRYKGKEEALHHKCKRHISHRSSFIQHSVKLAEDAAKLGRREATVVRETFKSVATSALDNMGGAAADRLQFQLLEALNEVDEGKGVKQAFGLSDRELRLDAQIRERQRLIEVCGMTLGGPNAGGQSNPHQRMRSMSIASEATLPSGQEADIAKHMFPNVELDMSDQSQGKQLLQGEHFTFEMLEQMAQDNQAIRNRMQEDHEAVYDFGDSRIHMPRALQGDKAGQLLSVETITDRQGRVRNVTLKTLAPKRSQHGTPTQLQAICDISALEQGEEEDEGPNWSPIKNQSHLHVVRKPPSVQEWLFSRAQRLRLAQEEERKKDEAENAWRSRMGGRAADTDSEILDQDDLASSRSSHVKAASNVQKTTITPWDARPAPHPIELQGMLERIGFDLSQVPWLWESASLQETQEGSAVHGTGLGSGGSGEHSEESTIVFTSDEET